MLWFVVDLVPNHPIVFYWMGIRLIERSIKHLYNVYINMGLRFELIWFDYFRLTAFYVLYPIEVIGSYTVLYFLFDQIKE
jgi:hypothetical protein